MDFFSQPQFSFHFLSEEAISVPAYLVISLDGFPMPTIPGLHELLYFWCYERIRARLDLYTFEGGVLIYYVQEERIEYFTWESMSSKKYTMCHGTRERSSQKLSGAYPE